MTGKAEVARQRQSLDATFERAKELTDSELLSDFARYLCVLVSGFLEQAVVELLIEYARRHSNKQIQRHIDRTLRRKISNLNSQKLVQLLGAFDQEWSESLKRFLIDEPKDAVDSVINLRNAIAHGRPVGLTMTRIQKYYDHVKNVVDQISRICLPN